MHAVVLAGGGGTRLWPLSRRERPKPFLPLIGEESLFQLTLGRIAPLIGPEDTIVVAEQRHMPLVTEQAPYLLARHLIGEPFGRNTAAAIALAAFTSQRKPDDVMVVLPADHFIADEPGFRDVLVVAVEAAQDGSLVTLGITASWPGDGLRLRRRFERRRRRGTGTPGRSLRREAAAREGARAAGRSTWRMVERRHLRLASRRTWSKAWIVTRPPSSARSAAVSTPAIRLSSIYEMLPNVSIDRALLEPASVDGRVRVVPTDVGWSDLGSWDALHRSMATSQRIAGRSRQRGPNGGPVVAGRAGAFVGRTARRDHRPARYHRGRYPGRCARLCQRSRPGCARNRRPPCRGEGDRLPVMTR